MSQLVPPLPKYHLLGNALAARIRQGQYDAEGLPGERQLAQEFGVARVTVRTALRRLAQQGLVSRTERNRTLPLHVSGSQRSPSVLRQHLDQFVEKGRGDKRTVVSFELVAAPAEVGAALDILAGQKVLRIVRVRTREGVPLGYTEAFVPERLNGIVTRAGLNRKSMIELLESHGVKIGSAEQAICSEAALPPVDRALAITLGTPVLKLSRVMRDEQGAAVQLLQAWYRSDRYEWRMHLARGPDSARIWIENR